MAWPEILKPWQRGLAQLYRISRQFVSATFQRRYKGHRRGTIINLSDTHRQRVGSVSLHGHIDTIFTPVCGGGTCPGKDPAAPVNAYLWGTGCLTNCVATVVD